MNFVFLLISLFLSINVFSKEKIKVAVLDTGIDIKNYPYIDKIKITEKDSQDYNGHGTHVTSIIIEKTKTSNYSIIPIKIFDFKEDMISTLEEKPSKDYVIEKAVKIAKKRGVKIINISGGGNMYFEKDFKIIKKNKDVLFVVASGNEVFSEKETDPIWKKYNKMKDLNYFILSEIAKKNKYRYNYYPCAYQLENIICVGNGRFEKNKFIVDSNFGDWVVDVFANGNKIENYILNGEKDILSGSSMATPQITALAIDILNENNKLSPKELKTKILEKLEYSEDVKEFSKTGKYLK